MLSVTGAEPAASCLCVEQLPSSAIGSPPPHSSHRLLALAVGDDRCAEGSAYGNPRRYLPLTIHLGCTAAHVDVLCPRLREEYRGFQFYTQAPLQYLSHSCVPTGGPPQSAQRRACSQPAEGVGLEEEGGHGSSRL